MTNEEKSELVLYKMARANETFNEVNFLLKNNFLNTAVSRLYYSCFYAVSALLIYNDIHAKKHAGVKQMFGLHFVATNIISREAGKFYTEIFELRQDSDYEDYFEFEAKEVFELLEPAQKLLYEIEAIILTKLHK
jgi:uncharacterized protein (UPF0332 family)